MIHWKHWRLSKISCCGVLWLCIGWLLKDTLTSDCATFQSERCSTLIPTLQQIRVARTDTFWMRPKKERLICRVSRYPLFWCSPGHQGFDQIKGWWWLVLIVVLKCAKLCLTVASTNQMNLPWSCCSAEVQLEAEEVPGPEVPWEASVACPFWSDKTILGKHWGIWLVLFQRCWTGRKAYVWINIHLQSGKRPLSAGRKMAWPCCQNIPLDTETRRGLGVRQIQEWWTLARNLPLLHPLQNHDFYLIAGKHLEVIFGPVRSRPGRWQPLLSDDHVRFRNWAWHLAWALGFVAICVCRVLVSLSIQLNCSIFWGSLYRISFHIPFWWIVPTPWRPSNCTWCAEVQGHLVHGQTPPLVVHASEFQEWNPPVIPNWPYPCRKTYTDVCIYICTYIIIEGSLQIDR